MNDNKKIEEDKWLIKYFESNTQSENEEAILYCISNKIDLRRYTEFILNSSICQFYCLINGILDVFARITSLTLAGVNMYKLPEEILKLKHISYVCLSNNPNLDYEDACNKLAQMPLLSSLAINSGELKSVPYNLTNCINLTFLDLGCNKIEEIPPSIGKLKNITTLYLYYNEIIRLPDEIRLLEAQLFFLDLSGNEKLDIIDTFKKVSHLKELRLLRLDDIEMSKIPDEIILLKNKVSVISLQENNLTQEELTRINKLLFPNWIIRNWLNNLPEIVI